MSFTGSYSAALLQYAVAAVANLIMTYVWTLQLTDIFIWMCGTPESAHRGLLLSKNEVNLNDINSNMSMCFCFRQQILHYFKFNELKYVSYCVKNAK